MSNGVKFRRDLSLRLLAWLFVGLFLLTRTSSLFAAELPAEKVKAIDEAVNAFMQKQHVPGLSLAIVTNHEISYEHGYGLADIENNVPATPETVYRLASISKLLTAVAAMQLVEQSKLDLNAPIQTYVPDFPEKQAAITCQHLLTHQSGIRHYKGDENRSAVTYAHVKDSFGVFKDDPLLFNPGEQVSYTTYGFNLLGAAIEGASGENYVKFVTDNICQPAGMTTMRPDSVAKIIPHRAAGYRSSGPVLVNDYAVDVSNKIPGGGWCSTAGDLARFAIVWEQGRLVKPETLEKMWTPQKTSNGKTTDRGLGCALLMIGDDLRVSHSGGQPKVSTYLTLSPNSKSAVAIMCNLSGENLKPLADKLKKLAVGGE